MMPHKDTILTLVHKLIDFLIECGPVKVHVRVGRSTVAVARISIRLQSEPRKVGKDFEIRAEDRALYTAPHRKAVTRHRSQPDHAP